MSAVGTCTVTDDYIECTFAEGPMGITFSPAGEVTKIESGSPAESFAELRKGDRVYSVEPGEGNESKRSKRVLEGKTMKKIRREFKKMGRPVTVKFARSKAWDKEPNGLPPIDRDMLKKLFGEQDKEGSGQLNAESLAKLIRTIHGMAQSFVGRDELPLDNAELHAQDLIDFHDDNDDGLISYDELQHWVDDILTMGPKQRNAYKERGGFCPESVRFVEDATIALHLSPEDTNAEKQNGSSGVEFFTCKFGEGALGFQASSDLIIDSITSPNVVASKSSATKPGFDQPQAGDRIVKVAGSEVIDLLSLRNAINESSRPVEIEFSRMVQSVADGSAQDEELSSVKDQNKLISTDDADFFEHSFEEGSIGLQIDHSCVVEEIDDGGQGQKCVELCAGDRVTHVNGDPVPPPGTLEELRQLMLAAGRPMNLRFSHYWAGMMPKDLMKTVSKARKELNTLRTTLEASQGSGMGQESIAQLEKLVSRKTKEVSMLEMKLDAAGYQHDDDVQDSGHQNNEARGTQANGDEPDQLSAFKVDMTQDNDEETKGSNGSEKKKKPRRTFRMYASVIRRVFTGTKKNSETTTSPSGDDENADSSAAEIKSEAETTEAEENKEGEEKNKDGADSDASNTKPNGAPDSDDLITGLALDPPSPRSNADGQTGTMKPSESMKWEETDNGALSTIMEVSEREEGTKEKVETETGKVEKTDPARHSKRVFGSVTERSFDPIDFRGLDDDLYELYERDFLIHGNGRSSSMSRISSDDDRNEERNAIRQTIKYYGKSLLVLFRVYASSSGRNKTGTK